MADDDYYGNNSTRQANSNHRYANESRSYSENASRARSHQSREALTGERRSYTSSSNQRGASERDSRQSSRGSSTRYSHDAQTRSRSYSQSDPRSRSESGSRSSSRPQSDSRSSSRSQSRSQSGSRSSSRSRQPDERLADYTRRNPYENRQTTSRTARDSRNRTPRQPSGGESFASRAWQILSAIASAVVSFFGLIRDRVPALQRFSASALALAAVAIVIVLVGGTALANIIASGSSGENEVITPNLEQQQTEDSSASENLARTVNPDEPADLIWRDSDFAVDPSFHNWSTNDNGRKVVYLTIDDGPSQLTEQYLDMLDRYNAKATFFVTGNDPTYYPLIREAYNRGHTIGLHSMTHDYAQIYASEQAFYKDLEEVGNVVKDQIGYVPCFIRFPGGSSNGIASSNTPGIMQKLANGVQARGYQYYDWSLSSGDGEVRTTEELIAQSTEPNGAGPGLDPTKDTNIVLLCHDSATKQSTLEALPKIIESYQKRGYSFEAIDRTSWVCHHAIFDDYEAENDSESTNAGESNDTTDTDATGTVGAAGATGTDGSTSTDGEADDGGAGNDGAGGA